MEETQTAHLETNWRELIPAKYFYPNKDWFARNNTPVPTSIDGLEDHQLLVKIGGLLELMRIRGYQSLDQQITHVDLGYVTAKCTIEWAPHRDTHDQPVKFSWAANSNRENCGNLMANFQETQAQNRALSLCIRKFLNINIASDEEMGKGAPETLPEREKEKASVPNINNKLRNVLKKQGYKTQESIVTLLEELNKLEKISVDIESLRDEETGKVMVDNLSPKECRIIMGFIENK